MFGLKGPFQVCRFFATCLVPSFVAGLSTGLLLGAVLGFQVFLWVFFVLYNHPLIVLLSSLVPVLTAVFKATCTSDPQIIISLPDFEALTAAVAELARVVQRILRNPNLALWIFLVGRAPFVLLFLFISSRWTS